MSVFFTSILFIKFIKIRNFNVINQISIESRQRSHTHMQNCSISFPYGVVLFAFAIVFIAAINLTVCID